MSDVIDLSGLNPDLDAANLNILIERAGMYMARTGPQAGDFVRMFDGTFRRFTHNWGKDIQTTSAAGMTNQQDHSGVGSFHLSQSGHGDYSGGLDSPIPIATLRDSGELHNGRFWFFRNNTRRAHNGVNVVIPCKVWIEIAR